MNLAYRNIIIASLLITTFCVFTWMILPYRTIQPKQTVTQNLPDAYMEGIKATIMNKNGGIAMVITSPKLTHYPKNDVTNLLSPQLTLYRKSPKPWVISAKHAAAEGGLDKVNFDTNVIIHHVTDLNNPDTVIKTSELTVLVNDEIAKTNKLITLIQPNIVVKAKGMLANMNTGDIKLLSKARGEYVSGE